MRNIFRSIIENNEIKQKYSFANLNFGVYFNNNGLKEKFEEKMYPFIRIYKLDNLSFNLYSLINDNLYFKIKSMIEDQVAMDAVASYCTKERGMVRIKKYKVDDLIVILSGKQQAFWVIDNKSSNMIFVGLKDALEHFHREYCIFFEHVLTKKSIEKGAILLHAAAVEKNNEAIILVGNKRSGKTTTFFELCKNDGYSPVSVDKILVIEELGRMKIYGVPTRLRVLAGTLSKYPELNSYIPDKYKNASQELLWKGESDSKVEIPIKEFEKFVGMEFVTNSLMSTLVFNEINKENEKPIVKIGFNSKNLSILEKNTFAPFNPEEDWWSEIGIEMVGRIEKNKDILMDKIKTLNFVDYETQKDFSLLFDTINNL